MGNPVRSKVHHHGLMRQNHRAARSHRSGPEGDGGADQVSPGMGGGGEILPRNERINTDISILGRQLLKVNTRDV
jgi:hypothetical protein